MMGVLYSETPRSLDPSSQTFQVIDLNSVQILIKYCHNNIHWPHFIHFGSLMLLRKYLKFRGAIRAMLELWFEQWILQWLIRAKMTQPWLEFRSVIMKKRARLKTPCLGGINASNSNPKKEFCEKVQNRWEIYNLKVAKFC